MPMHSSWKTTQIKEKNGTQIEVSMKKLCSWEGFQNGDYNRTYLKMKYMKLHKI